MTRIIASLDFRSVHLTSTYQSLLYIWLWIPITRGWIDDRIIFPWGESRKQRLYYCYTTIYIVILYQKYKKKVFPPEISRSVSQRRKAWEIPVGDLCGHGFHRSYNTDGNQQRYVSPSYRNWSRSTIGVGGGSSWLRRHKFFFEKCRENIVKSSKKIDIVVLQHIELLIC